MLLPAVLPIIVATACGGGSSNGKTAAASSAAPSASSNTDAPITTVATNDRYPFDATSAGQFPGTSLDQRLHMAKQVCDSIAAHGGSYPQWLTLLATQGSAAVVDFPVTPTVLSSFSGLAVKSVCPAYLEQLQGALNSLASSLSSASSSSSG